MNPVTEPNSITPVIQDELLGMRDISGWQIHSAAGSKFRYLAEGKNLIFVDWDGTGETLLKVTKHSQDRYFTRTPADDKHPDGKPIRTSGWSNFSALLVAAREEWFARACRKKAEAEEDHAIAARKLAQAEHDRAVDHVLAVAKSVAEESADAVSKSKVVLLRPWLPGRLYAIYQECGLHMHLRTVDVDAAILERIYWLLKKPEHGRSLADGRYIYNTIDQWRRDHFPMWSRPTLERAFSRLEKHQLLVARQPEGRVSRRKWYRLNPESIKLMDSGAKLSSCGLPSHQDDGSRKHSSCGLPSSESTPGNTAVVVGKSEKVTAAATATSQDELIRELQKQFPQHDVAVEFRRCRKYRERKGLGPMTARAFAKWMARAELPLTPSKRDQSPVAQQAAEPKSIDPPAAPEFFRELEARKAKKREIASKNSRQPQ
jgi:hypothetical protein